MRRSNTFDWQKNQQQENERPTYLGDLIYSAVNLVVEDAGDEKRLHIGHVDVQLLGDEGNVDASVGLDQFDQHLRPDVAQQILDVLSGGKR